MLSVISKASFRAPVREDNQLNIRNITVKISWRQNRSGSPTDPVSDRLDTTELLRPLRIPIFFERSVLHTLVNYVRIMHAVREIQS
jgi:hypothetical protein